MGRGADVQGCGRIAKYLLFLANLIIWIGSIAILILGIWAAVDKPYLENVLDENVYLSAAYILIAVGVIAFLLSFLGCFGAFKESRTMLLVYFILVFILFIILLVGGILAAVFYNEAEVEIKKGMLKSMKKYDADKEDRVKKSWDDAQMSMKCCGVSSYTDWAEQNDDFNNAEEVPKSCCKDKDNTNQCVASPDDNNAYLEGCYDKVKMFVESHAKAIAGVGIAVALLMILGLIFSLVLYFQIN